MSSFQSSLVLIVDDNPNNTKVLFDILKSAGYRVLLAQDGEAALETLESVTPDAILLDVMMPGIDGFETCRRIKQMPNVESVPIIFMTALSETEDKVRGLSLGAVDYITKPFQHEEVLARLDTHLRLYRLTQELRDLNAQLEHRVAERTAELSEALNQLKQSQLQLVNSEKMSALGQLVAGVAHEINNPVGFIQGNLKHATEDFEALMEHLRLYQSGASSETIAQHESEIDLAYLSTDLPKLLRSMEVGIERIASTSIALRIFSRLDSAAKTEFDIHDGINSTLLILKHRLKGNSARPEIEIVQEYDQIPPVECLPGQLNQVFMNLIANAIDAIEEKSQKYTYEELTAHPNRIVIRTSLTSDGQWVAIRIRDSGCGIPDEMQQKIFEYLFTTKPVGKGTGLGLSIAWQIVVDKHGGRLAVNSAVGEGTEFLVEIPIKA
ncbi:hybrid sensor histidine kinase/response regulator [Leptolyngbya sp. AN03gr2]|uniref:hybrid sensor histidine kinase/response regulator n=1 Tax=unclassified Leptolyngbya TaxID=2650499 RepID=UPI003D3173E7